jgi:triacylglycerol lipase
LVISRHLTHFYNQTKEVKVMKKKFPRLLILFVMTFLMISTCPLSAFASAPRQNNYPIVFVHGLAGFAELGGIPYWGGSYDVPADLESRGYENYVVDIGPFSSNWDRACEVYAELKGGTVDYGKAHSERYGHARFGRTYPGLYPEWGEVNPTTGQVNKIHLIGHSMGGETIRTLAQLLENGDADEIAATPANELSPLFNGEKKSWVCSILTVATPHDGSTATYLLSGQGETSLLQMAIVYLAAVAGSTALETYDFHLDQWGLSRMPGESFTSYVNRVENSNAWLTSRDLGNWDLKPEGAMELNSNVKAQSDIYYFSQATSATYKSLLTGHYLPEVTMNPIMWPSASYIGSYTQSSPVPVTKSWWENDGLVSVAVANGPHLGSTDVIVPYNGTPQIGKWNYLGKLSHTDHIAVVGLLTLSDQRPLFRSYAELLASLPQ